MEILRKLAQELGEQDLKISGHLEEGVMGPFSDQTKDHSPHASSNDPDPANP
jgi:hypothetical protein